MSSCGIRVPHTTRVILEGEGLGLSHGIAKGWGRVVGLVTPLRDRVEARVAGLGAEGPEDSGGDRVEPKALKPKALGQKALGPKATKP